MDDTNNNYAVLGVHDNDTIARVRMFIGDKAIDEDFPMPAIITIEQQLDAAAKARIVELQKGITATDSNLVEGDGQQIINNNVHVPDDISPATDTDTLVEETTNV